MQSWRRALRRRPRPPPSRRGLSAGPAERAGGGAVMRATRDYLLRMPPDTTVVAACHEVRCEAWQFGWHTLADERTPLGREQAAYIRQRSGRTFRELGSPDGMTVFRFESRQRCFAEHRTKPARWIVRSG